MHLYLIFFHLSVVLHSLVILNSSEYEIIILKYYCGRQIDEWAGPIDEWAVLTYGSEHILMQYKTMELKFPRLRASWHRQAQVNLC